MTAAQKMMMAAPAGGGAFNPETDIAWHSLFWAEGTDFVAEGYNNTDSVTTWPNDGTSTVTMFPEGTAPLFESSNSTLNSQPAVSFANTTSPMANATGNPPFTPTTNLNLDYTNGVSVVVITYFPTTVANGSKPWGRVSDNPRWAMYRNGNNWYWNTGGQGPARSGADANPHLFFGLNGGGVQGRMEIDGTGWDENGVAGDSLQAFKLYGGRGSPSSTGAVAFWALYEGDFRQDASYGDFVTWANTHYGLSIAAPPSGFDPETDVTWHSLFWAEGTDMIAENYANGDSVTTWPNETGGGDASQTTSASQPPFTTSATALNGKPAIDFAGSQSFDWTPAAGIPQPFSVVAVTVAENVWADRKILDGAYPAIGMRAPKGNRGAYIGMGAGSGVVTGDGYYSGETPVLLVGYWDSTTSAIYWNGVVAATGTVSSDDWATASYIGSGLRRPLAFLGIYEGDFTQDSSYGNFKTWVGSHYGITIA